MALQFTGNRNAKMSSVVAIDWDHVVNKPDVLLYEPQDLSPDEQKQVRENIDAQRKHAFDVRDFGALGDGITDDAAAIQATFNAASSTGGDVYIPATGKDYLISVPIVAKITGDDLTPGTPGVLREGDINRLNLISNGATLKATAAMDNMLHYTFDTSDSDVAPFCSHISGIRLNGNSLAVDGIYSDWTIALTMDRNFMVWGVTETGVNIQGYFVHMRDGYIHAPTCISIGAVPSNGGGDSVIEGMDLYPTVAALYCGGNSGNTIFQNSTATNPAPYVAGLVGVDIDGVNPADGSMGVNDLRIVNNEFRGFDKIARAVGHSSRNVRNIVIRDNHSNFASIYCAATIADFTRVDDAVVINNFINYASSATDISGVGVALNDCRRVSVVGNKTTNLVNEFATLVDCIDCRITDNTLRNSRTGSSGGSIITLAVGTGSTIRNEISRNKVIQGSGSYGQTFVTEGAGCDQTFLVDNVLTGVSNPPNLVGSNSISRELIAGAVPAGLGYYNAAEHVFKTAGGIQARVKNTASSVNYPALTGSATGNAIELVAEGSDTNVSLRYTSKGTGSHLWRVNGSDELELSSSAFRPTTTDGLALGDSSHAFSDLFLATGAVLDFGGDATLTHSTDLLTLAGANLQVPVITVTTAPGVIFNAAAGTSRRFSFKSAGLDRFQVGVSGDTELGGNAGSNFVFQNYDDAGVFLSSFLTFTRSSGAAGLTNNITIHNATAIPAGGTAGSGYKFSSTANFGVFFGSGVPTLGAAKGSLYLRSDGTTTNNRAYINTDGATTWTALTTVA